MKAGKIFYLLTSSTGVTSLTLAMLFTLSGCQESYLPASQTSGDKTTPVKLEKDKTSDVAAATAKSENSSVAKSDAPVAATSAPTAGRGPIRDITFDTLKFDMKKEDPFQRSMITPKIEKLDGSRIRIRGFIFPPPQKAGLRRFVLVRDNMSCCFGPGAALYDSIVVDMQPGETTEYNVSPISVEGTFNIRVVTMPDGKCISVYHLSAERVK